jgi:hypothetical protein
MSAADRQRQLLEVALNAFSRRGFKGTTTKEIAAAAGVAEAVIFQHFRQRRRSTAPCSSFIWTPKMSVNGQIL